MNCLYLASFSTLLEMRFLLRSTVAPIVFTSSKERLEGAAIVQTWVERVALSLLG